MKTIYIVIDKLITDEEAWETHFASLLEGYIEAANLTDCKIEEIYDISVIKAKFKSREIKPIDTFIFPNSWTNYITYVKHWSELYKTPVRMLGFWPRGCFINTDSEYRPMNDRNWRKVHERANFRCLDKSFFLTPHFKEQFRIYVSKMVFPERLFVCKFPLDYLSLEISLTKDKYYKQNMLIFPWEKYTSFDEQILYDFVRVFKDTKVIFAQEHSPLDRTQLLTQISKARVSFLPYTSPNVGQEIYESFLLETIPIVPDIEGLQDLVPKEFRYPPEWTANIFNYCKHAPDLTNMIKNILDDYDSYLPLIREHQDFLTEHYFDSEQIIKEIFNNDQTR